MFLYQGPCACLLRGCKDCTPPAPHPAAPQALACPADHRQYAPLWDAQTNHGSCDISQHLLHAQHWTEQFKCLRSILSPNTAVRQVVSSPHLTDGETEDQRGEKVS